ncbi:MAG: DUF6110 family protein [Coriobacteriales bacterium]|nr:DUF6110 family protein [Coriobacteriales bacterium]
MYKQGIGLLAAGFLLGSVGLKAATSKPAKKLYVQGVSKVLQARSAGLDIIEEAKSNLDDIIAEASYLNETPAEAVDAKPAASKA